MTTHTKERVLVGSVWTLALSGGLVFWFVVGYTVWSLWP